MPAQALTGDLHAQALTVVATYVRNGTSVRHVGLLIESANLSPGCNVSIYEMGPPLRVEASGGTAIVHAVGWVDGMTISQRLGMEDWLQDKKTWLAKQPTLGASSVELYRDYTVHPAAVLLEDEYTKVQIHRFSCVGLVERCYAEGAQLDLIDSDALPCISFEESWKRLMTPLLLAMRQVRTREQAVIVMLAAEGQPPPRGLVPEEIPDRNALQVAFTGSLILPEREALAILSALWSPEQRAAVDDGVELRPPRASTPIKLTYESVLQQGTALMSTAAASPLLLDAEAMWYGQIGVPGGGALSVWFPPEALLLRATDDTLRTFAPSLAIDQGCHDGRAYSLLHRLIEHPDDLALRREYARAMVQAPFRQVREDPTRIRSWVGSAWRGDRFPASLADLRQMLTDIILDLSPGIQGVTRLMLDVMRHLYEDIQLPTGYPDWRGRVKFRVNPVLVLTADRNDWLPAIEFYVRYGAPLLPRLNRIGSTAEEFCSRSSSALGRSER